MAAQDTDQEPSIEEILSSIRQIISDDDEESTPAPAPKPVEKFEPAPEPEDVVELTQRIDDDFSAPEPAAIEVDMQEADEDVFEEVAPEPVPEPVAPPPPPPAAKPAPAPAPRMESALDDDTILTQKAANAAMNGIAELARKTAVEHNGVTLEEIVRTELKPLLRDWLDRHLPSLIERLVQEELERVSKRVLEE